MDEICWPPERVSFAAPGDFLDEADLRSLRLSTPLETKPGIVQGIDLEGFEPARPEFRSAPATHLESTFRHSGWAARRQKTWNSLLRTRAGDFRMDRFRECGSCLWLQLDKSAGELRLSCNTCRDRMCVPCGVARAAKISTILAAEMAKETCRFVTLTRRHSPTPLGSQIDALYAAFARLRARSFWKEHVSGGAAFLECKIGERSGMWHCHLHIICNGGFMDQRQLSQEWLAVTQDSSIVDIRAISDAKGRARYVTKYVTKPADASVFADDARLDEMIIALKGRRLCATFGTWRGLKLSDDDAELAECEPLGSIQGLTSAAAGGDEVAAHWLAIARVKWPALVDLFSPSS